MNIHPKVVGSGLAAALVTVLVWALSSMGHSVPPEVATALTGIVGAIVGYLVPSPPSGTPVPPTSTPPTPSAGT